MALMVFHHKARQVTPGAMVALVAAVVLLTLAAVVWVVLALLDKETTAVLVTVAPQQLEVEAVEQARRVRQQLAAQEQQTLYLAQA
jgi:hypothetical protein